MQDEQSIASNAFSIIFQDSKSKITFSLAEYGLLSWRNAFLFAQENFQKQFWEVRFFSLFFFSIRYIDLRF